MSGTAEWSPVKVRGGGAPAGAPGGPPGAGPAATTKGAKDWASKNKIWLGAGAAGLVVVVALLNRGKGSDDAAAAGTTVNGATGGQGTYDSSASDVYNALQPSIEGLQNLLEQYGANLVPVPGKADSDVATPAPAPEVRPNTTPIPNSPGFGTILNPQGQTVVVSDSIAKSTASQPNFSNIATTANNQWSDWQQWLGRSDVSQADKNALVNSAGYKAVKTTVGK